MADNKNVNDVVVPEPKKKSLSPFQLAMRRFRKNKLAVAGLIVMIFIVLIAIFADFITVHDPTKTQLYNTYKKPGELEGYILGTDGSGRDVYSRLIHGSRISLIVGFFAMFVTVFIGIILGSIAGYYGGKVDGLIMRATDIMLNFPTLLLFLTIVAVFQKISVMLFILIIALTAWPGVTRIIRGTYLALREQEFIHNARAIGCSDARLIFRHLLPNAVGPIIVNATLLMANMIIAEAGLSFIGFGIPQPTPTWGNMMNEALALRVIQQFPNLWAPPGIAIFLTVLSINFIGDGLRDAFDTRMQR